MTKKQEAAEKKMADAQRKRTAVQPKTPMQWGALLKQVEEDHWRRLRVTIEVRGRLMAGKPAQLDAAKAMLKARGLEDQIEAIPIDDPEARESAAAVVVDEGLCEFHRREGKPGIWLPTNNIKAGLKENWSVLGFRKEFLGSRGALAEGVFVYSVQPPDAPTVERDWIYLGEAPHGIETGVSHTTGPKGPVSAIKRHEYLERPQLTFEVAIAQAIMEKLPDDAFARTLLHFGEHGVGACRSQGYGRFDIKRIVEVGVEEEGVASQAASK